MKMAKSLVLGSAAGLLAIGGAQAADLPLKAKAKAVEYVRVCSVYGPGFFYIPGTDTCIKLGGYLRADTLVNSNVDNIGNYVGAGAAKNRFTNGYTMRAREDFTIDTRTASDYGVVRTYFDATFNWTTDSYAPNQTAPGSTIYSPLGGTGSVAPISAPNNAGTGNTAAGTLGVYYAFIQFAGFTIGKADTQFAAPWGNYPGNEFDGLVGGVGDFTGVTQFSYTSNFGNGVSGTISAQDQSTYYQAGVNNLGAAPGVAPFGASDLAGTIAPDFLGNIRVEQAWGVFQVSAVAHDNHAAYYGGTESTGHPDDRWGWAGQLALGITNVPTGPGDRILVSGVYTNGATRYNIGPLAAQAGAATIFGGTGLPGVYQSVGFGVAPDTVFTTGTQQQLIQTWGFRGAFTHNWDAHWNTSLYGAYAAVSYNDVSKTLICGVGGSFRSTFATGVTACNPDYSFSQIGLVTHWTPVKNLTFAADLTFAHLDQKNDGVVTFTSGTVGKPVASYQLKDQNNVLLLLRAQRNW